MIEIREAVKNDLSRLDEFDWHISLDVMKKKIEDGNIIVTTDDGVIIGWLRSSLLWDVMPFMNMLFFLEEYRRKGLGSKLVGYWEDEMRNKGYKKVMTSTRVDEEAQHFYRKIGYKDIGDLPFRENHWN